VPIDLLDQHPKGRIVFSLRTRVKKIALASSLHLSHELDSYWSSLRVKAIASAHNVNSLEKACSEVGDSFTLLSDAKDHYLMLKSFNKSKTFEQSVNRNIQYAINHLGDKDLKRYSTFDATKLRDNLLLQGLSSGSVKRVFSSVKAVVGFAIKELGIGVNNPFLGVYIPTLNDVNDRQPVPVQSIKDIQDACIIIDDDLRWIIAIISDTGLRLSEAVGLRSEDVVLDIDCPYLIIRPNDNRRLKTKQSERVVPLVGAALWGASRALENTQEEYLFRRYNNKGTCNSNSASAALNKWLKNYVNDGVVIHSFRHSIRDRLRAVEAPSEIADSIGGWSSGNIGEGYGSGYPVHVLHKWLRKVVIPKKAVNNNFR